MKDCTASIIIIEDTIKLLRNKIQELREQQRAASEGKTTMKSLWGKIIGKNTTAEDFMAKITEQEAIVAEWNRVLEYLTIYIT
jgi:hypothetical protein